MRITHIDHLGPVVALRMFSAVSMLIAVGCESPAPSAVPSNESGEVAPMPAGTDAELLRRLKLVVARRLSGDAAVKLVGDLPIYDSDGGKVGVEFFDLVKGFEDAEGGTIAMTDISAKAQRVQIWQLPGPKEKDDISIRCAGVVWKKDNSLAYFIGMFNY